MNVFFQMRALGLIGVCVAIAVDAADYVEPRRTISNKEINGSSGLVPSILHPGVYFTHNDGTDNRIFAFDDKGRSRGTWSLEGVVGHDFEEMAWAMAHVDQLLLLADTGNNRKPERSPADVFHLHLLYAPEPLDPKDAGEPRVIKRDKIQTVPFRFEGGREDCEAVAVDWIRGQVLLINKVARDAAPESGSVTNVYALDYWKVAGSLSNDEAEGPKRSPLVARKIVTAMPPLPEQITGMDISLDGSKAVIQTYDDAYEFDFETDWATTFAKPYSRKIPVKVEPTGHPKDYTFREAICYGRDGKSLYITRELSSWEIGNTDRRTPLWKIR